MRSPPKYRNSLSVSAFFEQLGAKRYNPQWSWCGYNPVRRLAIFTAWEDQLGDDNSYLFFGGADESKRKRPGLSEITRVLSEVIDNSYDSYGVIIERRFTADGKSRIKSFDQSELLVFDIQKSGPKIFGHVKGKTDAKSIIRRHKIIEIDDESAIDDINFFSGGDHQPEYRLSFSRNYRRNRAVREKVLERAKGQCEYKNCGPAFASLAGRPYLEAHHIISLSADGPDHESNIIALCANHHREAHFGLDAKRLNEEFEKILTEMGRK